MTGEVKRCSKCGEEKAATREFFTPRGRGGPLMAVCKSCRTAQCRTRRGWVAPPPAPPVAEGMRRCIKCDEEKPATREFFYSREEGRLRSECKRCTRTKIQSRSDADKEIFKQKAKDWREKNCDQIKAYQAKIRLERRIKNPRPIKVIPLEKLCSQCLETKPNTPEYFMKGKRLGSTRNCCKACNSKRSVEWGRINPERNRLYSRLYNERHREKIRVKVKKRYEINRLNPDWVAQKRISEAKFRKRLVESGRASEYYRRSSKAHRERHKDNPLHKERLRQRYKENYIRNREKIIARNAAYRARRLEVPGTWTNLDINRLFTQQRGRCLYCGMRVGRGKDWDQRWHIDHFIPISRGGSNFPDNLVLACSGCNLSKHDKMPWEWMPERFSAPDGISME